MAGSDATFWELRVSELLEAAPATLAVLLRHGFTPLENPLTRRLLAPTVTLAQAVKLRGLSPQQTAALGAELEEALTCP